MDEVESLASPVRKRTSVGAHSEVMNSQYAYEIEVVVAVVQLEAGGDVADVANLTAGTVTDITSKEVSGSRFAASRVGRRLLRLGQLHGYEMLDLVILGGGCPPSRSAWSFASARRITP